MIPKHGLFASHEIVCTDVTNPVDGRLLSETISVILVVEVVKVRISRRGNYPEDSMEGR